MKLLVGLGNPGPKYELTRHNIGFLAVDILAQEAGVEWRSRGNALYGKGDLFSESCIYLKPQTFMNLSGRAVADVANFYKINCSDIIAVFDDLDLKSGVVKARIGGGHGGHNGVRSLIAELGSSDFARIKLGIGRPQDLPEEERSQINVKDWVLSPLFDRELLNLQEGMLDEIKLRLKGVLQQKQE